jgi:hypothetical protein
MYQLLIVLMLSVSVMSGYVTSEGRDDSGYGVGSNETEQPPADGPTFGSGVGRGAIIGSGG